MGGTSEIRSPLVRLAIYYGLLSLVVWLILSFIPAIPALLQRVHDVPTARSFSEGAGGAPILSQGEWVLVTLIAMLTAIALAFPVAWVYMFTKRRGGYDQSVVQTVIILPMTVAGTVVLVRNSLALAFALAAVIAAVRFRNTLKDTKDAVYIFMALAIGVAAGVVVPGVAGVMSLVFNVVVLLLWASNVGNIYAERLGGERAARLGPQLDAAADEKAKKRFNGAVLVRAARLAPAQRAAEALLEERTKRWKLAGVGEGTMGMQTIEYLVRVKDESLAAALIDAIKDRGAPDIISAEFRSLRGLDQWDSG